MFKSSGFREPRGRPSSVDPPLLAHRREGIPGQATLSVSRSRTLITCAADQLPPRAVATPEAISAPAMSPKLLEMVPHEGISAGSRQVVGNGPLMKKG